MNLSRDPRFRRDENSKTISYYCVEKFCAVDQGMIDAMCMESARWGRRSVRVCLHDSPGSSWHEMVILERDGHYFPPHRHYRHKSETLQIIDGELGVVVFDDAGCVTSSTVLGRDSLVATVGSDCWHLTAAMSDPTIYHESKPGPFTDSEDRAFATWAPLREDTDGARKYLEEIVRGLRE